MKKIIYLSRRVGRAIKKTVINEEVVAVWTGLQPSLAINWSNSVFVPAFFLSFLLDNGVDWASVVGVLGRYTYGLMAFFFAYCQSPGNIADYTQQFLANPCGVQCGLLSYLVLPSVHPVIGFILIIMSVGSFLQLLWDSVLMASFSFIQRVMGFLKPVTGHDGKADFSGVKFGPFSPNTAVIALIVGFLLMRGNSGEIVNAIASIASGLLLIGTLFLLGVIGGITRADICGGGGGG